MGFCMADDTDLIAAIYDVAIDPAGWDDVVKRIVAATGSISGALIVHAVLARGANFPGAPRGSPWRARSSMRASVDGETTVPRQADAGLWGATRIKFDPGPPLTLMRPSGALGQAGDGGDQDRAEHKAHDADRGKDKTLPSGQAFAFGIVEERGEFLVDPEISRLSSQFGGAPHVYRLNEMHGFPKATIATFGGVGLQKGADLPETRERGKLTSNPEAIWGMSAQLKP
jgi:hypothetical protein